MSSPNFMDMITGNVDYGAMYGNIATQQQNRLKQTTQQAVDTTKGQLNQGAAAATSNINVSGNRGNLAGPISAALGERAAARAQDLSGTLEAGIRQNAADKSAQITSEMDAASIQATQQQQQGVQQMIGNIIGGVGSAAGILMGGAV